ncbi:MAG TPA: UDP-3-O-(3-hydroxymyristoyl)glucosamine N-acyltransferase [Terriglobales bacterium]|nr:UDP-3-O-(3-hydroxymyristoyl)glucosamine N-acyltransferase [Terriglobales bacterium]
MKAQQIAEATGARVVGDGKVEVRAAKSVSSSTPDSIVFVEDPKWLDEALQSGAGVILTGDFAAHATTSKTLLITKQPKLAFARTVSLLQPNAHAAVGIHPMAVIAPTAILGANTSVGAFTVIEGDVSVGEGSTIGPNCFVGAGVKIGAGANIKSNVTIYSGTTIGKRATIHAGAALGSDGFGYVQDQSSGKYEKFPQVGRLIIGDDFEIGANSTVDRGALDETLIGHGVKIDNLVHIAHNVRIGDNVVIAAQTGISGSSVIADNVIIAGQVGIADHVTIEEGAILGAQCGVPSNKTIRGRGMLFWGTPARPIRDYLKELAVLSRLAKKK